MFIIQLIPIVIILWSQSSFWNNRCKKLVGILIVLFTAPSEEIWLNTVNSQVYFLLITFLILLEDDDIRVFKKWIYRILLVLSGLTGSISAFLAPMFIYKAWYEKRFEYYIQSGILIVCATIQFVILQISLIGNVSLARFAVDIPVFISTLWTRSIALTFLGVRNARIISDSIDAVHAWDTQSFLILNFLLAILTWIFFKFITIKLVSQQKILLLGSFFLIFVLTLIASLFTDKYPLIFLGEATRYFYVPNVILMILVFANIRFDKYSSKDFLSGMHVILLIAGISWGGYRYWTMSDMFVHKNWSNWKAEITEWRQNPHKKTIEIWPAGWGIWLGNQVYYPMTDELALTGTEINIETGVVNVNLQWQCDKLIDEKRRNNSYTAFVHLVDHQGVKISGYDNLLEDIFSEPSLLSSSYHPVSYPADLAPGKYDLVIGVYYFQDDKIINVNSTVLTDAVIIDK